MRIKKVQQSLLGTLLKRSQIWKRLGFVENKQCQETLSHGNSWSWIVEYIAWQQKHITCLNPLYPLSEVLPKTYSMSCSTWNKESSSMTKKTVFVKPMQSNQKHFYAGLGTKNLVLLQKNSICKTNAVKSKTFFCFLKDVRILIKP